MTLTADALELADEVLTQIDLHPRTWDQNTWRNDCGTGGCFAGWMVELDPEVMWAGPASEYVVRKDGSPHQDNKPYRLGSRTHMHISSWARMRLGLRTDQAAALFSEENDRESLEDVLDAIREGAL